MRLLRAIPHRNWQNSDSMQRVFLHSLHHRTSAQTQVQLGINMGALGSVDTDFDDQYVDAEVEQWLALNEAVASRGYVACSGRVVVKVRSRNVPALSISMRTSHFRAFEIVLEMECHDVNVV